MNLEFALNLGSALAAGVAAWFWFRVTTVKVPKHQSLTIDATDFDWLTLPIWEQTNRNRWGAFFAALAALLQTGLALLKAFAPSVLS